MERGKFEVIASRGDGFTQAIELVATTVLFALFGAWLDSVFDTGPLLAVVFGALAFAGGVAKLYYGYVAQMEAEEEGKPWARK